jgi:hypothetical protein
MGVHSTSLQQNAQLCRSSPASPPGVTSPDHAARDMRPPAVSRICNPAVGHLVVDCWRRRSPWRRTRDCFAALPSRDQTSCVQGWWQGPAPHTPLCTGARHESILHRSRTTRGPAVDIGAVAGLAPPCRHDATGARTRGDFYPRRTRGARAGVGAQGLWGRRAAHRGPAVAAAVRGAGLGDDARGGSCGRMMRRSVPAWAQGGPPPRPRERRRQALAPPPVA